MRFLVDTVAISVLFNPPRHPRAFEWLQRRSSETCLSVITLGELHRGVVKARVRQLRFAERLADWIVALRGDFADRTLPFDAPEALAWGELTVTRGNYTPYLLLAATALVHDLTVVTRNVRHFEQTGVRVIDPWTD